MNTIDFGKYLKTWCEYALPGISFERSGAITQANYFLLEHDRKSLIREKELDPKIPDILMAKQGLMVSIRIY
ncbi:MAG: hypothetical protein DRP93_02055 [Candidatus Neomarinimicrobiota bacterium]|nr:MAG: hypothetical protein DRP93_02055 [Candidatus Neomarinimicrobiota bacterium]